MSSTPDKTGRTDYWLQHSENVADKAGQSVQAHDWCCDAAFGWNQSFIVGQFPKQPRMEVLDVGCGNGLFTQPISRVHHLSGVDFSSGMVELACENGLDAQQGSAEDLPFDDGQFDAVVSVEMIQCVPNFQKGIQEMARVLKPGGKLVLQTLNERSWLRRLHRLFNKDYAELHMFRDEELRNLATDVGLTPKSVIHNFYPVPLFREFGLLRVLANAGATSLVLIAEKP